MVSQAVQTVVVCCLLLLLMLVDLFSPQPADLQSAVSVRVSLRGT